MPGGAGLAGTAGGAGTAAPTKSKRVRTGCLTCRERHLKCDEAVPDCLNCRKSNRACKRGVRLNFIDIQVKPLPHVSPTQEWNVAFKDESREIASEYKGGKKRYRLCDQQAITPPGDPDPNLVVRQQRRSIADAAATANLTGDGGRGLPVPYFTGGPRHPSLDQGYDEGQLGQAQSRRNSDASFLALGQGTNMGGGVNFSLASLQDQDQFGIKEEEAAPRTHAYRISDVSSIELSAAAKSVGPQSNAPFRAGSGAGQPYGAADGLITPPSEKANGEREYLSSSEEIFYMQVFVEEVGVWMDSLDRDKHFSRVIPYLGLKSPMLLNAFLACGVKHLTLVNSRYKDDKALFYYDTATTQLLRSLQNPDRNMAECATTAVVLNVYEIMSEKPNQRMSHIAGARALIRECGWDARSTGIGAACFWLNIGMEVLSCLSFNWQTAWDPDQWGLDLGFLSGTVGDNAGGASSDNHNDEDGGGVSSSGTNNLGGGGGSGGEEVWVHRIFYIVARIANFRANIPKFQEASPHDEQVRKQSRFAEWKRLKGYCDAWNYNCPRSMRPFGYSLNGGDPSTRSAFPNVWLIKRAAVIGRLFYHMAMVLLHQINPLEPRDSPENQTMQKHHAHQVCGIVAHTKDRGVASVAIRSLAIAACVLRERTEQDEVVAIFERINAETGWRLGKVHDELKRAWGWDMMPVGLAPPPATSSALPLAAAPTPATSAAPLAPGLRFLPAAPLPSSAATPVSSVPSTAAATTTAAAPVLPLAGLAQVPLQRPPVNPLLVQADFSLPNHPYQNWYEPPNRANAFTAQGFWTG